MKRTKGSVDWTKQEPITNTPRKTKKTVEYIDCGDVTPEQQERIADGHSLDCAKTDGRSCYCNTPRKATREDLLKAINEAVETLDKAPASWVGLNAEFLRPIFRPLIAIARATGEETK